jgi:acyl carrier protein
VVELVMAAEEEFDIEITDEEAEPLNSATVLELIDFLAGKLSVSA